MASWADVTMAFWQKYPNPHSKHVVSDDVIHRYVDPQTKCLHTTRLLKKIGKKPKWMNRFIGESPAFIVEESIVDPRNQTLTTYTKNITLTTFMTVEEKCVYNADATNAQRTNCSTQARVTSSLFSVGHVVEKFGLDRFKAHSSQAKLALAHVLERMKQSNSRALDSLRRRTTAHCEEQ